MNKKNDLSKYKQYAQDVLDGKIVTGKYIKLSCKRYLDRFERDDMEFSPEKCDKVVSFIQKLKHYQGKCAGQYFKLEPWQKWVLFNIFGFYWKGTNNRVTTKVLLTISRKNGKSFFAAGIAMYMLIADDERGAQILNVANNAKQAHLLFEMEQKCIRSIDPKHKYTNFTRDTIRFPKKDSYAQVLASDSSGLDGSSPSAFIADETHEQKDSKLWDVLISGQGYRESPLAINISTNGFLLSGFLHTYRDTCIDILTGLKEDDTQFTAIYELDEEDDWKNPEVWVKSNPNLGVTVTKKYLQEQVTNAVNNTSLEVSVRTKNLNQWVQSKDIWISDNYIKSISQNIDLEQLKGEICYMGVDLSAVSDLTCYSLMFPPNPLRSYYPDKYIFKSFCFVPEDTMENSVNSYNYKAWKRGGYLFQTSGNVVDYDEILLSQRNNTKDLLLNSVAYDSWNSTMWAVNATNEGMPLVPYSQSLGSFNKPTKMMEILIKRGMVVLDNNPLVRWCFSNVELKFDHNDNAKPTKTGSDQNKKIDPVISCLEALGAYLNEGGTDITVV